MVFNNEFTISVNANIMLTRRKLDQTIKTVNIGRTTTNKNIHHYQYKTLCLNRSKPVKTVRGGIVAMLMLYPA